MWARIGYVAITLLPPLGLHLATKIAGQPRLKLVVGAYGVAAAFAIFFMFIGHGMQSEQCLGNYVIFTTARWAVPFYALYYYGLLILTAMYSINVYAKVKKATIQKALFWLVAGYAAFVIPTTAVNLVDPSTLAGIPSIMCGFAVILAILLVTMVLPSYHKGNERISSHLRRKATRR